MYVPSILKTILLILEVWMMIIYKPGKNKIQIMTIQFNYPTIKENNVNREKELAKKEFALSFFPLLLVHNL